MKKLLLPLFLAAFVFGPAARSEANLITNGSFEEVERAFPAGQNWDYFSLGEVTGWTSSGAAPPSGDVPPVEVGLAGVYGVTGTTGNVLELDSTANATVSQQVNIATAGIYELTFNAALRAGVDQSSQGLNVAFGSLLAPQSLLPTSTNFLDNPFAFTLVVNTPGIYALSFTGTGTSDSFGTLIDDVQLNATSVPDGGVTAMLLGAALAGVGLVRRRMRA